MAESFAPVHEPNLFVQLADLVVRLLARIRRAGLDMRTEPKASQDLLATQAALLAGCEPADIPRYGKIVIDIAGQLQTRLSALILQGIAELGDALAAYLPEDEEK